MPADYASIIWVGLADLEFLRHERKGLSRLPSLQAKTARFGAPISIKRVRKDLVPATMADPYGFDWMALCPLNRDRVKSAE
jgi:hypothetical protein